MNRFVVETQKAITPTGRHRLSEDGKKVPICTASWTSITVVDRNGVWPSVVVSDIRYAEKIADALNIIERENDSLHSTAAKT